MENNVEKIIANALIVNKDNLSKNIKHIIEQIQKAIKVNGETILEANKIDQKNSNGFIIDFDIIDRIFANIKDETEIYRNVIFSQKSDDIKIIYGVQIMDYGNVVVISEGDPYIIIEMALRNILAGNTTIFSNSGFMYGTNQLIIKIIQSVLEQFDISKNLIQMYVTENVEDILSNYANINLVVCIGSRNLQNLVLSKSKNRVIISGYENFDLYIEDIAHIDFLKKIIGTGLNIQVYIKKETKLDYPNALLVDDIDEAIAQINYTGSRYSSAIFTTSSENASKFAKEVKSKMITINASPTIERIIDIKQSDLVMEKAIIYPNSFKLSNIDEKINIYGKKDEENVK